MILLNFSNIISFELCAQAYSDKTFVTSINVKYFIAKCAEAGNLRDISGMTCTTPNLLHMRDIISTQQQKEATHNI